MGFSPMDGDGMMGPRKPAAMPAPDMKQAAGMPQSTPSPFPASGFMKQGMGGAKAGMGAKPPMPGMMDDQ